MMPENTPPPGFSQGPPRYFRPVCVRRSFGFYGGPSGYKEADTPDGGAIDVGLDDGEVGPFHEGALDV